MPQIKGVPKIILHLETTSLLGLKCWLRVLMKVLRCQSFKSNRCLVSEYEVPNLLGSLSQESLFNKQTNLGDGDNFVGLGGHEKPLLIVCGYSSHQQCANYFFTHSIVKMYFSALFRGHRTAAPRTFVPSGVSTPKKKNARLLPVGLQDDAHGTA